MFTYKAYLSENKGIRPDSFNPESKLKEVPMAYFYIDDGYPESMDYENNYIYLDDKDPEYFQKIIELARMLKLVAPPQPPALAKKSILDKNRPSEFLVYN